MPRIFNCVQASPEWWDLRLGTGAACPPVTASEMGRILCPSGRNKGGLTKGARSYINQLIALSIQPTAPVFSDRKLPRPMQQGIDREPEARRWYEWEYGVQVQQVGFILSDCGRFGCSPDGLIGENGIQELKCPDLDTHIGWLIDGKLPDEHKAQVHGELLVSGREFCDFISYVPPPPRPLVIRVEPDSYTQRLREVLEEFWQEYQAALRLVREEGV